MVTHTLQGSRQIEVIIHLCQANHRHTIKLINCPALVCFCQIKLNALAKHQWTACWQSYSIEGALLRSQRIEEGDDHERTDNMFWRLDLLLAREERAFFAAATAAYLKRARGSI